MGLICLKHNLKLIFCHWQQAFFTKNFNLLFFVIVRDGSDVSQSGMSMPPVGTPPQQGVLDGMSSGGHGTPTPGEIMENKPNIESLATLPPPPQVLHQHPGQILSHNPHTHTPPHPSHHQVHHHLPPHSMIMSSLHDASIEHLSHGALQSHYTMASNSHAPHTPNQPQQPEMQYPQHAPPVGHHLPPAPPVTMHESMMNHTNIQNSSIEMGS